MNEKLKSFIEENIELIEYNDLKLLYNKAIDSQYQGLGVGKLTDILYAVGTDPLKYLTEIPEAFLTFSIRITNLHIPENIEEIGRYAFYMSSLETISIPCSIKKIDEGAFQGSSYLEEIKYCGTIDQFKQIELVGARKSGLKGRTIECTDGPLFIH